VPDQVVILALTRRLDHEDLEVRNCSAGALGRLGPASEPAIPALLKLLGDVEGRSRSAAVYALGATGTQADAVVRALVAALEDLDEKVRFSATGALMHVAPSNQEAVNALTRDLQDEDPAIRGNSAFALGMIGPPANSAIPQLKTSLTDHEPIGRGFVVEGLPDVSRPTVSAAAAWALGRIAPDASDTLSLIFTLLDGEDGAAAWMATLVLDEIGFDPDEHVLDLFSGLRSENSFVRKWSLESLAQISSKDEYISQFVDALYLGHPDVEKSIIESLGVFAPNAQPATPILLPLLDSRDSSVLHAALRALALNQPNSEVAFNALIGKLKTTNYERDLVIAALGSMTPPMDEAVVPVLVGLLQDDDRSRDYSEVAYALGDIGPAAADAVPILIERMTSPEGYAYIPALYAYAAIGPAAAPAVPSIIEALRHPYDDSWITAARALGAIGPAAVDGVPEIVRGLGGTTPWTTKDTAVRALAQVGPGAVPALTEALYGQDRQIAQGAAEALGLIAAQSHDLVPVLVGILKDEDFQSKELGIRALGVAAPAADQAVPTLVGILEDPDSGLHQSAVDALSGIGPAAKDAVPLILKELNTSGTETRRVAAYALAEIKLSSSEVVAALVDALGDGHVSVRGTAAYALSTMGEDALLPLMHAIEDPNSVVRAHAASGLGQMGSVAGSAVSNLISLYQDSEPTVRLNAVAALGSIAHENDDVRTLLEVACKDQDRFVREQAYLALYQSPVEPPTISRSKVPLPAVHLESEDIEIEPDDVNLRHVQFKLVFDHTNQTVHVAGLKSRFASDGTLDYQTGFDEASFGLSWLDPNRFLHAGWSTIPQGRGGHNDASHILLVKREDRWHEIYRDSFYSGGSWGSSGSSSMQHAFAYEPDTNILTIERYESGWSPVSANTPLSVGSPAHNPRRWSWENSTSLEWRYRLGVDKLEYIDGKQWIGFGEHSFDVSEVAEYHDSRFAKETIARLRLLNPTLRDSDRCSGAILLGFDVAPREPWGGDSYGSME